MSEIQPDPIERMIISEVDFVRARKSIEKRLRMVDGIDEADTTAVENWNKKHKEILDTFFTPNRASNYINKSPSAVIDELTTSETWKER